VRSILLQGFSPELVIYACLLQPVVGVVSLTAGRLPSSVQAEFSLQLCVHDNSGFGMHFF
jgi:hypothetical protein